MFMRVLILIVVLAPLVAAAHRGNYVLRTLDDLQNRLSSVETRSDTEIANLKESLTIADTEIANLKESSTIADTEIANLKESLTIADTEIANLKESLTIADTEIANLKESLTIADTEIANLKESSTIADTEIANLKESSTIADTEIANLKESLTIADTEIANLKESSTIADAKIANLGESLSSAEARSDTENTNLKEDMNNAEDQINQQGTQIAILQGFVDNADDHTTQQNTAIASLQESLSVAEADIARLKGAESAFNRSNEGSTYVRWGRTSCPGNGSELVYGGYAGGSHYTHPGAAVDYLCLPTDPSFAHYEDAVQTGAYVYGAEYTFKYRNPDMAFFPDNDQTINLHDKDVPCAVCRTVRSAVLMVPARTTCHDGWTLEYKGYLSAGRYDHTAASQFVCLDGQPESVKGGGVRNDNGVLFYFVEGRCGSLKCPPYVNGRELTCAVCSI